MDNPTQEQEKELWEWCGLTTKYNDEIQYWYESDGKLIGQGFWEWSPPLDLNNLYRYAVPKALDILGYHGENFKGLQLSKSSAFRRLVKLWMAQPYPEDKPALALFWAIYEIMEAGK